MRSVAAFFLLAYAAAWAFFVPAAWTGRPGLFLPGVFAPAAVALWLTARAEGSTGVRALLARVVQWRVSWRWYALAIGYLLGIKLAAAVIHRMTIGAWPRFGTTPWFVIVVAVVISTPFQAGEEIGWRGYALPRLAARFGYGTASVVLGVVWAVWHLPQFFVAGADTRGQSFPLFVLQVTALSVALAWVYMRTNGSLLLTMLMHSAVNNTKDVVPSVVQGAANAFALSTSVIAWLTVALLWIGAGYFLVQMRRGRLLRAEPPGTQPGPAATPSGSAPAL